MGGELGQLLPVDAIQDDFGGAGALGGDAVRERDYNVMTVAKLENQAAPFLIKGSLVTNSDQSQRYLEALKPN